MPEGRLIADKMAKCLTVFLVGAAGVVLFLIGIGLLVKAEPILGAKSLGDLLFSSNWRPFRGEFGFFPFIMGTAWVTAVAVVLAVPFSVLTALYLSEYAHRRIRAVAAPMVDLLAGIPSVVFGIWGVLAVVPMVRSLAMDVFGIPCTGYSVLTAGIVLALMVCPIVIHVTLEVLRAVPNDVRDVSLALGATKWQTTKLVVLRKALPGIGAAVIMGVSRAFGETMAVLMVAGNVVRAPDSLFSPAYPLPALIANNYGEMLSIPMYDAALMLAALMLFVVVVVFNAAAKLVLQHLAKGVQ
ncbi:MAG: phosphate ABC transporter permease subunit PstC [Lentisphaerae bacterium GWF2_52_8]|nr:MAG: phosphate ABC transporter permease subunit PstC [Lentisphaerae bacterium GWF2_52_8]